jgi:hypothetical protein
MRSRGRDAACLSVRRGELVSGYGERSLAINAGVATIERARIGAG